MSDPIRILSIDGGGIRGIIPAMVLQELLGKRDAKDVFHLIAGTSTGGIIACGLAKPKSVPIREIIDLYVEYGSQIFRKRPFQAAINLFRPKYFPRALEHYLSAQLGDAMLSDVRGIELLVPSYAIKLPTKQPNGDTRAPMFFRSWQARGLLLGPDARKEEYDFCLESVARATSAAPTFFPPANIRNRAGQSFSMIDGGVFANNPAIAALVEAYHLYHSTNFLVVSLGTGEQQMRIPARAAAKWGEIAWMLPILSVLTDGVSDTVCFETEELLRDSHYRFDVPLGSTTAQGESVDERLDDASPANIAALQDKARQLIESSRSQIRDLAKLLQTPKADVRPAGFLPRISIFAARAED